MKPITIEFEIYDVGFGRIGYQTHFDFWRRFFEETISPDRINCFRELAPSFSGCVGVGAFAGSEAERLGWDGIGSGDLFWFEDRDGIKCF